MVADLLQKANPQGMNEKHCKTVNAVFVIMYFFLVEKEELERVLGISGRDSRQYVRVFYVTAMHICLTNIINYKSSIHHELRNYPLFENNDIFAPYLRCGIFFILLLVEFEHLVLHKTKKSLISRFM